MRHLPHVICRQCSSRSASYDKSINDYFTNERTRKFSDPSAQMLRLIWIYNVRICNFPGRIRVAESIGTKTYITGNLRSDMEMHVVYVRSEMLFKYILDSFKINVSI